MEVARELDQVTRTQRRHSEVSVYKPAGAETWYYRVQIHGKRFNRSTGQTTRAAAIVQARALAKELRAGGDARTMMVKPGYATAGQLADVWMANATASTAADNVRVLARWISSWHAGDWREVSLAQCTGERFERWLRDYQGSDVGRKTTWATLRALWQPKALRWYAKAGLVLPDVAGLREVRPPAEDRKRGGRFQGFRVIGPDVLARMDAAAEELRRAPELERRRVWAVYSLMRWCGLRNSEVAALRWGWIVRGRRGPVIELVERTLPDGSTWQPKGSSGTVPVRLRLLAQVRRAMRSASSDVRRDKRQATDYVIPRQHATDAARLVEREINDFVRPFLPDRQKGAYELRKQFGAEISMRDGIEVASRLLRHGSISTTWGHYHALVNEPEPL